MTDSPASGSDLCRSCGLCCNGVLFDFIAVDADESDELVSLGLNVHAEPGRELRFDHPCPKFCGDHCAIYDRRPAVCRAFRCELLKKLEDGRVSLGEALGRVAEAKALLGRLAPGLHAHAGPTMSMQWKEMFRSWQSRSSGDRTAAEDNRLILELTRLHRFLDLHFRGEKHATVTLRE